MHEITLKLNDNLYRVLAEYFTDAMGEYDEDGNGDIEALAVDLIRGGLEGEQLRSCEICGKWQPFNEMTYGVCEDLGWTCRECADEIIADATEAQESEQVEA